MGTRIEELIQPHIDRLQERLFESFAKAGVPDGQKLGELWIGYCCEAVNDAWDELTKEPSAAELARKHRADKP